MAKKEKSVFSYKGKPLVRFKNIIYYGNPADKYIAMLQIMQTEKIADIDVATKVIVQLQLSDPNVNSKDRVVKTIEKPGLYSAMEIASIWLDRALSSD